MSKLTAVKRAITSTAGLQKLKLEKNSPHILFGVGMVGFATTVVLASKATLSLERVVEAHEEDRAAAQVEAREHGHESPSAQQLLKIYSATGFRLTKLYGPALLAGAVTVGCLTKSHQILTQRNVALTAAYIAVDRAFKQYRSNVVEKYGEEADLDLRRPTKVESIIDEKGKVVGERIVVDEEKSGSPYSAFFTFDNPNWNPTDPSLNLFFLKRQQKWLNDRLMVNGHVFLNEVYDELGLPRTTAGAVVGWLKKDANGNPNYIDFGIFDGTDPEQVDQISRLLMTDAEGIWLDFNVDGPIFRDI